MKELKDLKLKDKEELRKLDIVKLSKEVIEKKRMIFELKMKKELGELKQTHLIKFLRKYLAMLSTLKANIVSKVK